MKIELQQMINEFIEGDFSLDDMTRVLSTLQAAQCAKRQTANAERYDLREMYANDEQQIRRAATEVLRRYELDYELDDLI